MILDSEDQRKIILELIRSNSIPGEVIDEIYEFKQLVVIAKIDSNKGSDKGDDLG